MRQRVRLDPSLGAAYLALTLAGCAGHAASLLPTTIQTVSREQVDRWVSATEPSVRALHRFTWLYQDEQSSKGGRGSARIAPPDSLRFDIAGSLGIGKGSAMVVGDTAVWVVPERAVRDLVPNYPLLWALFGVARRPGPDDRLAGIADGQEAAWRYADGVDTVEYRRQDDGGRRVRFVAEVRKAGKVIGRATTTLGPDGKPTEARLIVPDGPAKLEIKFYATLSPPAFPPETWAPPEQP
jgi:hypothetical protein